MNSAYLKADGIAVRQRTEATQGERRSSLSIVCAGAYSVAPLPLLADLIADDAANGGSADSS
ncbi:hypothetical protein D9M68_249000 [compost metagenome]